ncbi:MAG TPA: molybdopterin-dependent oxidoreductase [Steroidobacteraceae bacterium]|nr:molybdopterin-dependent oxidoreductase [Steroidobacteraceae bacterium]HQX77513.1 molybdopterin-dependent oxidoreductase [Steroidobacteraceae bacterium]
MNIAKVSRREALLLGISAATGGLLLGCAVPRIVPVGSRSASGSAQLNAWVSIAPDGIITLITPGAELGQGIYTSLPMILAEDMEADFADVRIAFCGYDRAYNNPVKGYQATGQSAAVRGYFPLLRRIGAGARDMLLAAAAERWHVPISECAARASVVWHSKSKRKAGFGELAADAARQTPPADPTLKAVSKFRLIGTRVARKDTAMKVDGSAQYAADLTLPGMVYAAVRVSPVAGGRVVRLGDTRARGASGVLDVVRLEGGVAVVAKGWWQAQTALGLLELDFDGGAIAASTDSIDAALHSGVSEDGRVVREVGDVEAALHGSARVLEWEYKVPYLAHATMEPMSCVASVEGDRCTVWAPTQGPTVAHAAAAKAAGVPPENVQVHRMFIGGGFGRRYETDFVTQVVQISRAVGLPVKLLWSREEDMTHDFYRPAARMRYRAGLAADGSVLGVDIVGACGSILARMRGGLDGKADAMSVDGVLDREVAIANLRISHAVVESPLPVGMWRSVSHSQNGFFKESFMDELAHAAGRDGYEYRRALFAGTRQGVVLELAAERAGWGVPLPPGRARGIAIVASYGSIVAQVVEVSLQGGEPRVHRVVCAVDCGLAIDPHNIAAQMEGGIVYGLSAALWGNITVTGGAVEQRNFHQYRVLRMNEMPKVETYVVPSTEPPGGIGECAVPPIAPAIANALFALSGKRIRALPIANHLQVAEDNKRHR